MISWDDFEKVDIRIGTITEVENFKEARKPAWKLKIDFGNEIGIKKSSAQIKGLYSADYLMDRQVVAVVNFAPKQIANYMSECLVLGINDDEGNVVILETERKVENGKRVY